MMLAPLPCLLRKRLLLLLLAPALVVTALLLLSRSYSPALSRVHWRSDWSWVDMGASGMAPMRRYRSFDHASVDVRFVVRDERRCSREQIFLATRGSGTEPGAVILDHAGELVWRQPRLADEVHDFRVQEYRGQKFLTFWAGTPDGGGKQGSWYLMDDTYTIRHNVSASGFEFGDMHEFELTPNGTALVTIYNPIPADLSAIGGPAKGYILDGIFQEIDLETGALLFQWKASDHIPLSASRKPLAGCSDDPKRAFLGCGHRPDAAFDYYHINSVQKDPHGNYLVSGRHTSSLTYINGTSGAPLWHMGGELNQFDAVPLGTELLFAWQHDARLQPDGTTITLLDNNAYDPHAALRTESRGLRLRADFSAMNVTLVTAYRHPQRIMAFSQGNAQVLPATGAGPGPGPGSEAGNVFVGWGSSAAFTEFAPDGAVLCDARFAPAALFSFQPLSSYRAYRGAWVGRPPWPPSVAVAGRAVYASWNGATEVAAWRLQGRRAGGGGTDGAFEDVLEVPRTRFETEMLLQGEAATTTTTRKRYDTLRVQAVDAGGTTLGTSAEVRPPSRWLVLLLGNLLVVGVAGAVVVGCVVLVAGVVRWRRRRQGRKPSSAGYELLGMAE